MGEDASHSAAEVTALRAGLDLGVNLIDTAEMYADGGAELVVAEAIAGRRDEVFLVSKVLPHHASFEGTLAAAEGSLRRLGTDRIDLYLLHWPGPHPLEGTYNAFRRLREQGKVRSYGVSNFDVADMERSESTPGGAAVGVNQVLYNLSRRNVEHRLLPWCRERGITLMAYSPFEQARLAASAALARVAARHDREPYQVALAWTIREPGVVTIPKASRLEHVRANAAAAELELTAEDLSELDCAFPRGASAALETL